MIRNREISAKQLVELYLQRLQRFDGRNDINSYITVAAESALGEAEELDTLAKQGHFKGILHGLPIAVKDNLDTKNMRTTGGSSILSNWIPPADASVVGKLKAAGAIVIGKTNMHEFARGVTTNNPHYGPTRNPYDKSRIPGRSSGGSVAATAAAFCAGALGTDTGGSVRIPAALCGVVGLKPTLGRVGRGDMMYLSFTRDVIGPITRTVRDSAMILEIIGGIDPRDAGSSNNPVPGYSSLLAEGVKGKRFGVPRKYFYEMLHQDTQTVIEGAIKEIMKLGGTVKEVELKDMGLATSCGFNIVHPESVYLFIDYLKSFDPEATIDKYLMKLGPDVRHAYAARKGHPMQSLSPGTFTSKRYGRTASS